MLEILNFLPVTRASFYLGINCEIALAFEVGPAFDFEGGNVVVLG
jgi:hypothetical protein